jgi:hypothetical protein
VQNKECVFCQSKDNRETRRDCDCVGCEARYVCEPCNDQNKQAVMDGGEMLEKFLTKHGVL